jgi:hypothetical protein
MADGDFDLLRDHASFLALLAPAANCGSAPAPVLSRLAATKLKPHCQSNFQTSKLPILAPRQLMRIFGARKTKKHMS